ncbi:MAG: hypothetical protein HOI95_23390 [Chromatiales bacterium]|jgi:hypothetical protein|nr:hypothetical protein [Chromatiales bacterium]
MKALGGCPRIAAAVGQPILGQPPSDRRRQSGIGLATARRLARDAKASGSTLQLALVDRPGDSLQQAATMLHAEGA